jgi:hypothetical protein
LAELVNDLETPMDAVRERFYAISVERRFKHPAVVTIFKASLEAEVELSDNVLYSRRE